MLAPGGVACHTIDHSDHWQHRDRSLPRLNFLQFPANVFRWTYLNRQNYQNRLRHVDYIEIVRRTGLEIVYEDGEVDAVALSELPELALDSQFMRYSADELAVLTSTIIARKIC